MYLGGSQGRVCHKDGNVALAVDAWDVADAADGVDVVEAVEAVNATVAATAVVGRVDVDDAGT